MIELKLPYPVSSNKYWRRSVEAARASKVNKELSKQFRVFRPTYGPVMGVWV